MPRIVNVQVATQQLTLGVLRDDANMRRAAIFVLELGREVMLWEGDAYTTAGDYTEADIAARALSEKG